MFFVCLNVAAYGQSEALEEDTAFTALAVPTLSDTLRAIPTQHLSVLPSSDCKLDGYERRKLLSKTQWVIIAQKRAAIDFMRSRIDSLYYVEAMLGTGDKRLELLEKSLLYNKFFIPSVVEKIRIMLENSGAEHTLADWEKLFYFWKSSADFLYHSNSIQKITYTLWLRCMDEMNELNSSGNEQQTLELYNLLKKYFGNFSYDAEKEKSILNDAHSGIFNSYVSVALKALHRGLEKMSQNYSLKAYDYYTEHSGKIAGDNVAKKILISIAARYRAFASLSDDDERDFYLSEIDSIYSRIGYVVEVAPAAFEESVVRDTPEVAVIADAEMVEETAGVGAAVEAGVADEIPVTTAGTVTNVTPTTANVNTGEQNFPKQQQQQSEQTTQEALTSKAPEPTVPAATSSSATSEPLSEAIPQQSTNIITAEIENTKPATSITATSSPSQQHKRLTPQLKKQIEGILDSARLLRLERKFYLAHFLFERAYKLYPQTQQSRQSSQASHTQQAMQASIENEAKANLIDATEQLLNKAQYQLWNSKANTADSLYMQAIQLCKNYDASTDAAITVLFTNYLFKRNEILCRQFSLSVVSDEKKYVRMMKDGKLDEGLQGLKRLREEIRAESCFSDTTFLVQHIRIGDSAQIYYSLKRTAFENLRDGDTFAFIEKWLRADSLYMKGFFSEYVSNFKPLMRRLEQANEVSIMEKWLLLSIQKNDFATALVLMEKIAHRNPKSKILKRARKNKELKNL